MINGAESVSARLPTQLVCADNRMSSDSSVSMTEIVWADDDVNLRVSTGLLAAIDTGFRR